MKTLELVRAILEKIEDSQEAKMTMHKQQMMVVKTIRTGRNIENRTKP